MSYTAQVYNVMLASPSDVSDESSLAREVILDWNNIHSATRNIVLLPISWEYNSVPAMGDRPQEIINEQVLKHADILVGIFWTRIGTPTGKAVSGTVEEIGEHIESGKSTMLYFSKKPVVLDSVDAEQYKSVTDLKREFQKKGLTTDFDSLADFKEKFQRHLSMRLNTKEYQAKKDDAPQSITYLHSESTDIRHQLSTEAQYLLKAASIDRAGEIHKAINTLGSTLHTNGEQINEDYSPRTNAKWEAALNELLKFNLIDDVPGYAGEYYKLSAIGFRVADELN